MEVHYDNPGNQENVVDTSGLRFWTSEKLRPQDMKTTEIGYPVFNSQVIPPRQEKFVTVGMCPERCLSKVNIVYYL